MGLNGDNEPHHQSKVTQAFLGISKLILEKSTGTKIPILETGKTHKRGSKPKNENFSIKKESFPHSLFSTTKQKHFLFW